MIEWMRGGVKYTCEIRSKYLVYLFVCVFFLTKIHNVYKWRALEMKGDTWLCECAVTRSHDRKNASFCERLYFYTHTCTLAHNTGNGYIATKFRAHEHLDSLVWWKYQKALEGYDHKNRAQCGKDRHTHTATFDNNICWFLFLF